MMKKNKKRRVISLKTKINACFNFERKTFIFILCVALSHSLPAWMFVYHMCMAPRKARRGSTEPMEPELQPIVSHHVGAMN